MGVLKEATLLFLIKKSGQQISQVCLAMKKRGFGQGRWNGVGGKVEPDETIEQAAVRETKEEIGVNALELAKVAELTFIFPHHPDWNQFVHVYFCEEWQGEPAESEEMKPQWFNPKNFPFAEMWTDDEFWLPEVIKGNLVKGFFVFAEGDKIREKIVETVENF